MHEKKYSGPLTLKDFETIILSKDKIASHAGLTRHNLRYRLVLGDLTKIERKQLIAGIRKHIDDCKKLINVIRS